METASSGTVNGQEVTMMEISVEQSLPITTMLPPTPTDDCEFLKRATYNETLGEDEVANKSVTGYINNEHVTIKEELNEDSDEDSNTVKGGLDNVVCFENKDRYVSPSPILQYVMDIDQPFDTIIACADGKIGAHRLVLVSASPMFLGCLFGSTDIRLGELAVVILPDIRVVIMKYLLSFCYTGTLTFPEAMQDEIFDSLKTLRLGEYGELNIRKVQLKTKPDRPTSTSNIFSEQTRNERIRSEISNNNITKKEEESSSSCITSDGNVSDSEEEESFPDAAVTDEVRADKEKPKQPKKPKPNFRNTSPGNREERTTFAGSANSSGTIKKFKPNVSKSKPVVPTVLAMLQRASQKQKREREEAGSSRSVEYDRDSTLKAKRSRLDDECSDDSKSKDKSRHRMSRRKCKSFGVPVNLNELSSQGPKYKSKIINSGRSNEKIQSVWLDLDLIPQSYVTLWYGKSFVKDQIQKLKSVEAVDAEIRKKETDVMQERENKMMDEEEEIEKEHQSQEIEENEDPPPSRDTATEEDCAERQCQQEDFTSNTELVEEKETQLLDVLDLEEEDLQLDVNTGAGSHTLNNESRDESIADLNKTPDNEDEDMPLA